MGLHNSIHPQCSPRTDQASDCASSTSSLVRTFRGKRLNGAEPGSFFLHWPLEVLDPLSYFLEVDTKSLLAAQALGAVLGAS